MSAGLSLLKHRRGIRDLGLNATVALAYIAAGIAGLQFALFNHNATSVWVPSGIALASLLLWGPRTLPAIALGAFAVNLWNTGQIGGAIGVSIGNSLEACAGWWVLSRWAGMNSRLERLRDVGALMIFGAAASPIIAATIGTISLRIGGGLSPDETARTWLVWWFGDALGILLFTPLILAWTENRTVDLGQSSTRRAIVLLAAQTVAAQIVFHGWLGQPLNIERATYALLPFAVVLAATSPLRYSTIASAVLFLTAIWQTAHGTGPFAAGDPTVNLILLHVFIGVTSFTTLLVAGVNAERAGAMRDLRRNVETYRRLSELSAEWYWEQDENLRFTLLGESRHYDAKQTAGSIASGQIGMTRWEIPHAGISDEEKQAHDRLLAERKPFRDLVVTRFNSGGEARITSTSGYPIFDEHGRFRGYRGIGRDVTEIKKAEFALRASEARFRSLTDLSSDWYWEQDDRFRITYMSPRYSARTGLAMKPTLGQTRFETDNIWESEEQKAAHRALLEAHLPFRELRLSRYDDLGQLRFLSISGEPVFDQQGRFTGYRGIGRDITEQKLAERALRASEERFRDLTELSSDWYWEQDAELRFTFVSSAIEAISGVDPSRRIGKRRWEIAGLQFNAAALEEHRNLLAAHEPFRDFRYIRVMPDGRSRHISVTGMPLFDADRRFTGYRGLGREVTVDVVTEQRMARLRDFYAALSKVNNAIIHATDQQGLFDEVCDIAVTYGHVIFARICVINPASDFLDTVAVAGNHQGYPFTAKISIEPDLPEGQGPAGIALRTDKPYIGNDIRQDERNLLWLPAMTATGARSIVVFPLHRGGKVFGSLHLYASETNWFDDALVTLVTELAANLSFALDNFEREAARQSTEKALRESERRFRDIADAAGEFVWENDSQGRFTYVSPRAVDFIGYEAGELIGRTPAEFMPGEDAEKLGQWLAENMHADRSFRGLEHRFITKSGETLWMQVSAVSTWDEHGNPTGHRGTTRDVTALKKSEARISHLATRDPLTELPNRLLFNDRLEQGIIAARRKGDKLGVLFIDLDRFKNINDSLGHHIGDLLLKEVSGRMAACVRKGDTLSRLGGDEFVVTLEGLAHAEDAAHVALKISEALHRPISVGDHLLNTSCSIGISIYPNDAEDSQELMKNADTAMYHAKERGRNNFQFFSPEMNLRAVERHQLETELRVALEAEQFVLHYQPQVDIRTGKLVGIEALIRWQHPQRGLVPPNSFIPVAEESGLIEMIGKWALRAACEQNQRWQMAGLPIVKIAVNISARQFNDPRGFAEEVTRLLNATGLDPRYLELEMTESMLLKNVDENVAVLRKLAKLGTSLAVDDFGTGYSSLAYLKQLPIDTLKIDRTFVRDIETDADDAAIIRAIIAMAHSLDLRVTAEGVETQGQLVALRKLRCDQYQGYLISRPVPAEEFAPRFLEHTRQLTGKSVPR
jgi:diguanylate cyclase (GGDEF)-like protein/PAS domain S-box-containing protein